MTLKGTCAAALLLERLTTAPPLGAALLNVRLPVEACPPVTADGLTLTDCNATADVGGGTTLPHHVLQ